MLHWRKTINAVNFLFTLFTGTWTKSFRFNNTIIKSGIEWKNYPISYNYKNVQTTQCNRWCVVVSDPHSKVTWMRKRHTLVYPLLYNTIILKSPLANPVTKQQPMVLLYGSWCPWYILKHCPYHESYNIFNGCTCGLLFVIDLIRTC